MKLLNINYSDYSGGSAIACSRIHDAFLKCNADSWLAVCESNNIKKNILTFSNNFDKIEYLFKKKTCRFQLKFFEKKNNADLSLSYFNNPLFNTIDINNFDLVNLHWIGNETISLNQINKIKKPIIWTLTDMWSFLGLEHINYFDIEKKYYWNDESILFKSGININNYVIKKKLRNYNDEIQPVAISQWMADMASQSIIFKNKKVDVIPCTIDFDVWKPSSYAKSNDLFECGNKKIILFSSSAGTDDYKKGFSYLINALKKIKNLNDYHLVVLGRLNKQIMNDLNISFTEINRTFFENTTGLLEIYSSVDLVVMPSLIEAFGQVALEAAACEIPTIAFNNTGVAEIISHKKNGYLAEYKNTEDLAFGINWCLEDINLRQLKNNSRTMAMHKFSNKLIINKYKEVYKKLI